MLNPNRIAIHFVAWGLLALCSCSDLPRDITGLKAAAQKGNHKAMATLGHRYMVGDGVSVDYAESLKWLELSVSEKDAGCDNCLAWLLATCPDDSIRDGRRAVAIAEKLVAKSPTAAHIDTLAAGHAAAGDFDKAFQTQREAISKLEPGNPKRLSDYRERLKAYKNREVWLKP